MAITIAKIGSAKIRFVTILSILSDTESFFPDFAFFKHFPMIEEMYA